MNNLGASTVYRLDNYRNKKHYQDYLKTLSHGQLDFEMNHLIKKMSNHCADQAINEGRLLLNELSIRAEGQWQGKINKLIQALPY